MKRGASAVEFALCMPFAVLAIVGMADFATWTMARHAVSRAVQDACTLTAKVAIPDGGDDGTYLETMAKDMARDSLELWGGAFTSTEVTASWAEDEEGVMWLRVTASMPFQPVMGSASPFRRNVSRSFVVLTQEQIN